MTTYVTHPDNLEAIKKVLELKSGISEYSLFGIQIQTNNSLPRERPSGKFIFPDGRVVTKEEVSVHSRFVDYGPEDLDYLLYAGIVRNQMEMHFYEIDEFRIRMMFDAMPMMSYSSPMIIRNFC